MRTINFKIEEKDNNRQIRDFLKNFGVSSSLLVKLKKDNTGILLNGNFAKTIEQLKSGDVLTINIKNSGKRPTLSSDNVEIVYSDEDILVANKPPFMPCHESRNHQGDALSNAVAKYLDEDCSFRSVYRLDRDTSGLVVIAKNELAASKLAGKIKKDYFAVVEGELNGNGTIDLPIDRESDSIIKRKVSDYGEKAVTHWQAVKSTNGRTLVKVNLETGRTHQIRVHFSHIGMPLVGDTLYGSADQVINRQALHCKSVSFIHPVTMKEIIINSDFPEDIKSIIGG